MRALVLNAVIAIVLFQGTAVRGEYGAYLFIDGIEGESEAAGREGWIDVFSVSHGIVARENDGRLSGGELSGITVAKQLDKATPVLKRACAAEQIFPAVVIDFVRKDAEATRFYRLRLEDVSVYEVKLSVRAGPEGILETIALEYAFIEWEYTEFETTGAPVAEHRAWWDRASRTGGFETVPVDGDPSPPRDPESFRRSVRFSLVDDDSSSALLSWESREGSSYGVYYSPDLLEPFDTLVEIVPSEGDGITSTVIEIGGRRGFYIVRELE